MAIVTTQEHQNNLATAAYHRELEVYQYQINIDNYTVMLSALPDGEWPDSLIEYKAASIESLPSSVSDEDIQAISDYQYRDRMRGLLRTERIEQNKAIRVLDALKTQIVGDYNALILQVKTATT